MALALERRHPDRAGEIALHFDAAGEKPDAYHAAQLASKMADRVHAHGAAGQYLQIAGRNASTPGELAEIRVSLAHVAETGGRFDEVEELCDLAIEWFDGQSDERRALTLRRMRERARMELDQPARKTLEAMLVLDAEAQRLGFDSERVAILLATRRRTAGLAISERRSASRAKASPWRRRSAIPRCSPMRSSALATRCSAKHQAAAHAAYSRAFGSVGAAMATCDGQALVFGEPRHCGTIRVAAR